MVARREGGKLTLANFMQMQLYSALGAMSIGMEILAEENVEIEAICGHGGFFKCPFVGANAMSAALGCPITVMKNAGGCVGPLSMVLVGLVLSSFSGKDLLPNWQVVVFCLGRLLFVPLAVLGICKGLAMVMVLPEAVYPSAVLMACMPCGLNPVIYPKLIGKDCSLGAKLIPLTAILSIATIPFWMKLMGLM